MGSGGLPASQLDAFTSTTKLTGSLNVSQPLRREVFLESSLQKPGPLFHASQAETLVTSQPRHETIFRPRAKPLHHVLPDNFTVLYHLREKLRPRSSLSKP
jgi:hypothetical protein